METKYMIIHGLSLLLGVATLIPSAASKPCMLGYFALCSFTPISTVLCLAPSAYFFWKDRQTQ